jgi:ABC-type Zn uptake system ZnuABC Zn-binding protein ZnuA
MKSSVKKAIFVLVTLLLLTACEARSSSPSGQSERSTSPALQVLAAQSYLADITRNVAGERAQVDTLIPIGLDPHLFEPTPSDVAKIAASQVLVVNGAGFEEWLDKTLQNAGGDRVLVEASAGLTPRKPQESEIHDQADEHAVDPHFWFDPTLVVRYVENIRAGLTQADPAGEAIYHRNAEVYIAQLKELDGWIQKQVEQIPPKHRRLVTDHESFGYFADRYGFEVSGAIIPSASTGASPSARQLTELVEVIRAAGVRAIFVESLSNARLAEQVGRETGVQVVTGLYTHSLTATGDKAATYIEMMKYNTAVIVEALK